MPLKWEVMIRQGLGNSSMIDREALEEEKLLKLVTREALVSCVGGRDYPGAPCPAPAWAPDAWSREAGQV